MRCAANEQKLLKQDAAGLNSSCIGHNALDYPVAAHGDYS
jgi:hypothetical protein